MAFRKFGNPHLFQDVFCLFRLFLRNIQSHFIPHTLRKQLVVYILHDHIAFFQALFGVSFCSAIKNLASMFPDSAKAPGKR